MSITTIFRSSLAVLSLGAAFACADGAAPVAPRTVAPDAFRYQAKDGREMAVCRLQKESWKTVEIGARGGRIDFGSGNALEVPAGALTSTVAITAHSLRATSASVQFLPEGLLFAVPATLKLRYTTCNTPLHGVKVVYVQADTVAEVEPSRNHPLLKWVAAPINHFSSYAVAF